MKRSKTSPRPRAKVNYCNEACQKAHYCEEAVDEDGFPFPIVIDCDSALVRVGYANGENEPLAVFPSVVGRPRPAPGHATAVALQLLIERIRRHEQNIVDSIAVLARTAVYTVGQPAYDAEASLHLSKPIERSFVTDWDAMEQVWRHTFRNVLQNAPSEGHPILLTEAPLNPKASREALTQIMFETFDAEAMYVCTRAVLSLYSSGRTSGIVLEVGDGGTYAVPIHEGYMLPHGFKMGGVTGQDLTDRLTAILAEHGLSFVTGAERETVRKVKGSLFKVAPSRLILMAMKDLGVLGTTTRTFELLGEQTVSLSASQCCECPEAFFHPGSVDSRFGDGSPASDDGQAGPPTDIADLVDFALDALLDNDGNYVTRGEGGVLVLTGEGAALQGFAARLKDELGKAIPDHEPTAAAVAADNGELHPTSAAATAAQRPPRYRSSKELKIITLPDPMNSGWQGGAILSSLSTFKAMWVTRPEYDEVGPTIIHRKCF